MLILFDIDGTLVHSEEALDRCFMAAVQDELNCQPLAPEWERFDDVTDAAILDDLFRTQRGRLPSAEEVRRVQADYQRRLFNTTGVQVRPIAGAKELLAELLNAPDVRVALATGNWFGAAHYKLEAAGIDASRLPMATASDATRRSDILRVAIQRAGGVSPQGTVYVGDGTWDAATASALQIGFVGVAADGWGHALRRSGVSTVVRDFRDPGMRQVLAAAARAPATSPPGTGEDSSEVSLH